MKPRLTLLRTRVLGAARRRFKHLLLLAASLLFALLSLEVAARAWLAWAASPESVRRFSLYQELPERERRFVRHHYLNYALRPGYCRGKSSINSLGFRGPEFPQRKPPGVFRIAVLGGSSTYDDGIDDDALISTAVMERLFHEKYGCPHVHVINAGVPGYTSWESLINLEFRVLDVQPDLVLVYHGVNDLIARLVNPLAYRGDNAGLRKPWEPPPPSAWEYSCLLRILGRLHGLKGQVALANCIDAKTALPFGWSAARYLPVNPPVYFLRNLVSMASVARAHGVRTVFSTWAWSPITSDIASKPDYQQGFEEGNRIVRRVAQGTGSPLFDLAAVMPKDPELWLDGRHVNEKGAAVKGALLADFLYSNGLVPRPAATGPGPEAVPSR